MTPNVAQGFVLHSRPYRNTSLIVEFFTLEHGRIACVARGARRPMSPFRGQLQPFIPLWMAFSGRGSLQQCLQAQARGASYELDAVAVYSGLYLNELLMRLCPTHEPLPALFEAYQSGLGELMSSEIRELVLRRFERLFLQELGYGLNLSTVGLSPVPISPEKFYDFDPQSGFCSKIPGDPNPGFSGHDILGYAQEAYSSPAVLQAAKHINRLAIEFLLGGPLKSRQLAQALQRCRTL